MNHQNPETLVWLTVNCSWSHSSLALPLIHQASQTVSGWQWKRVEAVSEEDSARIAVELAEMHCTLLCTVLYLFNRNKVLDILKRVHELCPGIHIAVGGPECPACDAAFILRDYPFISTVFCGEGEAVFPEFLRTFAQRRTQRSVIPECGTAVYETWADAPLPENDEFFRTDKPFVQIETSRGCPMSCAYCTSSGVKVRYRDLARVEEELRLLSAKGVKEVRVLDRTFNLPQERGAALLNLFQKFPGIHFHLEIHPRFIGEELKTCFRNANPGQLHIEAGIQSLDPDVQTAIGRRSEISATLDGLHFLTGCTAFETHTDLLAGLPSQTFESLCSDILTLIRESPAEIQLEVLKMLPGTPMIRQAERYGMVWSPDPPYDVMRTGTMDAKEILRAMELSRLLDLFYNHPALHPVFVKGSRTEPDLFLKIADALRGRDLNTLTDLKKRMLCLAGLLKETNPAARTELALQWIMSGYPPEEGPGKAAESVREIPPEAQIISGAGESLTHYGSRFLRLRYESGSLYLVLNRSFRCNRPCCVLKQ